MSKTEYNYDFTQPFSTETKWLIATFVSITIILTVTALILITIMVISPPQPVIFPSPTSLSSTPTLQSESPDGVTLCAESGSYFLYLRNTDSAFVLFPDNVFHDGHQLLLDGVPLFTYCTANDTGRVPIYLHTSTNPDVVGFYFSTSITPPPEYGGLVDTETVYGYSDPVIQNIQMKQLYIATTTWTQNAQTFFYGIPILEELVKVINNVQFVNTNILLGFTRGDSIVNTGQIITNPNTNITPLVIDDTIPFN